MRSSAVACPFDAEADRPKSNIEIVILLVCCSIFLLPACGRGGGDDGGGDGGTGELCDLGECNLECLDDGYAGGVCNSDDECECAGGGSGPCSPGVTQSCMCPNGDVGTQMCAADGTHWQPCDCPSW